MLAEPCADFDVRLCSEYRHTCPSLPAFTYARGTELARYWTSTHECPRTLHVHLETPDKTFRRVARQTRSDDLAPRGQTNTVWKPWTRDYRT